MSENNYQTLETITINDFKQICRLCPSKSNLTDIYNNPEIIDMLQFFPQLRFEILDDLPNHICDDCMTKLIHSYKFFNSCKLVDEAYRNCLNNPEIKVETIKQEEYEQIDELEFDEFPVKEETPAIVENSGTMLQEFVRLGIERGCNSLLMRYFTERVGAESLSLHIFLTSFIREIPSRDYDVFMRYCKRQMTDELCACVTNDTVNMRKQPELSAELRYGRISSSKMYTVSCCERPDEYYIENIIGFYKMSETKGAKINDMQKIEAHLNVKIEKRGLVLNREYPEFVAKLDGVTDEAVIKLKFPKNKKGYSKYVDSDMSLTNVMNLTPRMKMEMHLGMLLANRKTGYLCIVDADFANINYVAKVDFNERYFMEILAKCRQFWKANIYPALLKTVLD